MLSRSDREILLMIPKMSYVHEKVLGACWAGIMHLMIQVLEFYDIKRYFALYFFFCKGIAYSGVVARSSDVAGYSFLRSA